jgi:hypothetical protein
MFCSGAGLQKASDSTLHALVIAVIYPIHSKTLSENFQKQINARPGSNLGGSQ